MGFHIGTAKASRPREGFIPNQKLKLLEQVSEVMRFVTAEYAKYAESRGGRSVFPCPDTPELLAEVIVTLRRPAPSLYWKWRLGAGARAGGWIGSAPGLKAGERAAERGSWRAGCAATGGRRAQREEAKS
jgi:hypothetical protein